MRNHKKGTVRKLSSRVAQEVLQDAVLSQDLLILVELTLFLVNRPIMVKKFIKNCVPYFGTFQVFEQCVQSSRAG